jgi:hypothetical protein
LKKKLWLLRQYNFSVPARFPNLVGMSFELYELDNKDLQGLRNLAGKQP